LLDASSLLDSIDNFDFWVVYYFLSRKNKNQVRVSASFQVNPFNHGSKFC